MLDRDEGKARIMTGRFVRLAETDRPKLAIEIDGKPGVALEGDTLLVALLTQTGTLRISEFGDGARAGFCLMGVLCKCWRLLYFFGRIFPVIFF